MTQQRTVWIRGFLGGALLGALALSVNTTPTVSDAVPPPAAPA
jgi:hypothetical protein